MTIEHWRARFMARLVREPEPDGCWIWPGHVTNRGYGQLTWKGRRVNMHRIAYEWAFGPIPDGLIVCHRCDVRRCCNPAHLFLGSHADNAADRDRKGRNDRRSGERHPMSRLTADEVREVRHLKESGVSAPEIARRFGVSRQYVYDLTTGRRWAHLD
jgi:DNA-binding CsgD family transcriptional regulator